MRISWLVPIIVRLVSQNASVTLLLLGCALGIGVLIGAVGIGGILLTPALVYLGGLDVHAAMAVSMWSFLFTGVIGAAAYARHQSVDRRLVAWLTTGVVPAALLGGRINGLLPETALLLLVAAVSLGTGVLALVQAPASSRPASLGPLRLLAVGAFVGLGSALTGTGGPVLLVPTLLLLHAPVLLAVGASQVIQIPVAAFALFGYAAGVEIDVGLEPRSVSSRRSGWCSGRA